MAQNTTNQPREKCSIVILGEHLTGKSSIIKRYIVESFDDHEQPTIGIDFFLKKVEIDNTNTFVKFYFWDTSGQEKFRALIPNYIRSAQAAIICYDITNEQSFQNLSRWVQNVQEEIGNDVFIYILGNKIDLEQERKISKEQAQAKAKELGAQFYEVSAKKAKNVLEFFKKLQNDLLGNFILQTHNQQQQQQFECLQQDEIQQSNQPKNLEQDDKQQGE